jgi:hypothetical protein
MYRRQPLFAAFNPVCCNFGLCGIDAKPKCYRDAVHNSDCVSSTLCRLSGHLLIASSTVTDILSTSIDVTTIQVRTTAVLTTTVTATTYNKHKRAANPAPDPTPAPLFVRDTGNATLDQAFNQLNGDNSTGGLDSSVLAQLGTSLSSACDCLNLGPTYTSTSTVPDPAVVRLFFATWIITTDLHRPIPLTDSSLSTRLSRYSLPLLLQLSPPQSTMLHYQLQVQQPFNRMEEDGAPAASIQLPRVVRSLSVLGTLVRHSRMDLHRLAVPQAPAEPFHHLATPQAYHQLAGHQ